MRRNPLDRPEVILSSTANLAVVGQFAEIPQTTTLNIEYGACGAQLAVYKLTGLHKRLQMLKRYLLMTVFDWLAGR
ncbi:hypothetical protein EYZ11_004500 [Aspergillus tanneri]|uniref:Uncharacterized protein n=1 Tax=Aspergillus tanneri TaxID=1220188 RepID=A0A4S3JR83_9EURO|nr:hypothetical protein EYZ11_004500 [Aspergillus tanneri]